MGLEQGGWQQGVNSDMERLAGAQKGTHAPGSPSLAGARVPRAAPSSCPLRPAPPLTAEPDASSLQRERVKMNTERYAGVALDYSPSSRYALKWSIHNCLRESDHLVVVVKKAKPLCGKHPAVVRLSWSSRCPGETRRPLEEGITHLYNTCGIVDKWLGRPTLDSIFPDKDPYAKGESPGEGPVLRWTTDPAEMHGT